MDVLVTVATGKQGGAVAKALLRHGHRVRALTRTPNTAAAAVLEGREHKSLPAISMMLNRCRMRRADPDVQWETFDAWAERQDWRRLLADWGCPAPGGGNGPRT